MASNWRKILSKKISGTYKAQDADWAAMQSLIEGNPVVGKPAGRSPGLLLPSVIGLLIIGSALGYYWISSDQGHDSVNYYQERQGQVEVYESEDDQEDVAMDLSAHSAESLVSDHNSVKTDNVLSDYDDSDLNTEETVGDNASATAPAEVISEATSSHLANNTENNVSNPEDENLLTDPAQTASLATSSSQSPTDDSNGEPESEIDVTPKESIEPGDDIRETQGELADERPALSEQDQIADEEEFAELQVPASQDTDGEFNGEESASPATDFTDEVNNELKADPDQEGSESKANESEANIPEYGKDEGQSVKVTDDFSDDDEEEDDSDVIVSFLSDMHWHSVAFTLDYQTALSQSGYFGLGAGLESEWKLKDWALRTGLSYQQWYEPGRNFNNDFTYVDTSLIASIDSVEHTWVDSIWVITGMNQGRYVYDTMSAVRIDTLYAMSYDSIKVTTEHREPARMMSSRFSVPLTISYQFEFGNFTTALGAGVVSRFTTYEPLYAADGQSTSYSLDLMVQPSVAYRFGQHWGAELRFDYLSPLHQGALDLKHFEKTDRWNLGLAIRYYFY